MTVIWVHEEMLSRQHFIFREYGLAPAAFVFDEEQLRERHWSLKRIVFVYECLLEMPVEIVKGHTVEEVRAFARGHEAREIVTVASPDPFVGKVAREIPEMRVIPEEPFVALRDPVDLKRFSRYWRKAEPLLFR